MNFSRQITTGDANAPPIVLMFTSEIRVGLRFVLNCEGMKSEWDANPSRWMKLIDECILGRNWMLTDWWCNLFELWLRMPWIFCGQSSEIEEICELSQPGMGAASYVWERLIVNWFNLWSYLAARLVQSLWPPWNKMEGECHKLWDATGSSTSIRRLVQDDMLHYCMRAPVASVIRD